MKKSFDLKNASLDELYNEKLYKLANAILGGVQNQIEELKTTFQPKEPTEYLTRNEVKELLHIDLSTVHNWTKKGKLKAYGIGNRIYYKRHELEQSIIPIQVL